MKRLLLIPLLLLAASWGWSEPLWWQAATGPAYQVLVYSFADSDGDGRGDLNGLTHRLDALKSLGVTALWLNPLQPAASYHGYDVVDYKSIDPAQGSLADFDALVKAAHARGIHLIMDMVFNHTSTKHPWFKNKPSWYLTKKPGASYGSATMGGWINRPGAPAYFATFWDQMPDLDVTNPEVVAEFRSILKFWLDRGVDGFRFDAAREILNTGKVEPGFPVVAKTKEWWNALRDYARSINPAVYFIGEVSTTSNLDIRGYASAFDGLFDFVQAKALVADLSAPGTVSKLVPSLETNLKMYLKTPGFIPSAFLSNHDQDRAMSVALSKFDAPGQYGFGPTIEDVVGIVDAKNLALTRYKGQAFFYLLLPGMPYVYYGEELGMVGRRYQNDDIGRRDAFPWGDEDPDGDTVSWTLDSNKLEPGQNKSTPSWYDQDNDPTSVLAWYRTLGTLRVKHPALRGLAMTSCTWPGANDGTLAAFFREGGGEKLLATVNFGRQPTILTVPAGTTLKALVSSSKAPAVASTVTLAPGQAVLWSVDETGGITD